MFLSTKPWGPNPADNRNIRVDNKVTPEAAGAFARLSAALVMGIGGVLLGAHAASQFDEVPTAIAVQHSENPVRNNLDQLPLAGEVVAGGLFLMLAAKVGSDALHDLDALGH